MASGFKLGFSQSLIVDSTLIVNEQKNLVLMGCVLCFKIFILVCGSESLSVNKQLRNFGLFCFMVQKMCICCHQVMSARLWLQYRIFLKTIFIKELRKVQY